MDHSTLLPLLSRQFPEHLRIVDLPGEKDIPGVEIAPSHINTLLQYLKTDPEIRMGFLTDLCGVHYPDQTERELCVVYHLHSLVHNLRLRVKAFIPINDPVIPSATAVYPAANWMERETYDFYGILFEGHPDLRRILNVDEMDYFPMRKEYPLEDITRKDKDDRFFGRDGHEGIEFDKRVDRR